MQSIYLDYNATTPIDGAILEAMHRRRELHHGNPSSVHHAGRGARALLDDCRYRLASLWQCRPSEMIFTSGGGESNNLALFGAMRARRSRGRHLIVSAVEHHSVLHATEALARLDGCDAETLPVDAQGRVSPGELRSRLRRDTVLVSVMAANNETGVIQPWGEIGRICREADVLYHCDAVQAMGKLPFASIGQYEADLVSVCSHKLHGPKGVGALFCRSPLHLEPLIHGGSQEHESRGGTENLAGIYGMVLALERFSRVPVFDPERIGALSEQLVQALHPIPGVRFHGMEAPRLPNTLALTVDGWESATLLAALDLEGICASGGAACSAGSVEPSHVLLAMGLEGEPARSLVRFSLGRETTEEEIDAVVAALAAILSRGRTGSRQPVDYPSAML